VVDFEKMLEESAREKKRRAKILIYGGSGAGKTVLSLCFPRPIMLDLEKGSECYRSKIKNLQVIDTTKTEDFPAILEAIKKRADRETIIIDSMSEYWSALQSRWLDIFLLRNRGKGNKEDFYEMQPKDWSQVKGELKDFLRGLLGLDMNVICTARLKDLYSDEVMLKKIGETFDCERNLPYLFDTVVKIEKSDSGHFVKVEKDRTGLLPKIFPAHYLIFACAFKLEGWEKEVVPVQYLPESIRETPITVEALAQPEGPSWQSKEGKSYTTRQLVHIWAGEKNQDPVTRLLGRAIMEKYPSQKANNEVKNG
jgi:GTPase SAR1 family protein